MSVKISRGWSRRATVELTEKVGSDKGKLVPTDIGMIVTDFLVNHFITILDYNFTAKVRELRFNCRREKRLDFSNERFLKDFHPNVEDVKENAQRESGERILGKDPKSGRQLLVRLGKFGPIAQIGTQDDEEAPVYASLTKDMNLSSITLEEAIDLFQLPKDLGQFEGEDVIVSNGRFGPYVKFGALFLFLKTLIP